LVILRKQIAGLSEGSFNRFILRARRAARIEGGVNVLVTSSAAMRSFNLRFRGVNRPTDVLSFPSKSQSRARLAGEIAISADIATQNALRLGHAPAMEVKVLALHGLLHLAGMDHERDNGEMARKEAHLRQVLHLPSTLTERAKFQTSSTIPKSLVNRRKKVRGKA
jgi:probable rRNA maturation factor